MTEIQFPQPLLQLSNINHSFGLQKVLQGIDLQLEIGERLAMVGPSGCGKTTLMHLMAGLLEPQQGQLHRNFQRGRMVFQQPRLLPWQNALGNLTLGLKALGLNQWERIEKGRQMAHSLGLSDDDLNKYPDQLSGGMQSRIALGRALITEPDLLLMDEPFSALDIGHKERLYQDLLRMTGPQCSAIIITHDLLEAVRLADRILVLAPEPGRLVAEVELSDSASARDDLYVHHNGAKLLQHADIRMAFGLPPKEEAVSYLTARVECPQFALRKPITRPQPELHSC